MGGDRKRKKRREPLQNTKKAALPKTLQNLADAIADLRQNDPSHSLASHTKELTKLSAAYPQNMDEEGNLLTMVLQKLSTQAHSGIAVIAGTSYTQIPPVKTFHLQLHGSPTTAAIIQCNIIEGADIAALFRNLDGRTKELLQQECPPPAHFILHNGNAYMFLTAAKRGSALEITMTEDDSPGNSVAFQDHLHEHGAEILSLYHGCEQIAFGTLEQDKELPYGITAINMALDYTLRTRSYHISGSLHLFTPAPLPSAANASPADSADERLAKRTLDALVDALTTVWDDRVKIHVDFSRREAFESSTARFVGAKALTTRSEYVGVLHVLNDRQVIALPAPAPDTDGKTAIRDKGFEIAEILIEPAVLRAFKNYGAHMAYDEVELGKHVSRAIQEDLDFTTVEGCRNFCAKVALPSEQLENHAQAICDTIKRELLGEGEVVAVVQPPSAVASNADVSVSAASLSSDSAIPAPSVASSQAADTPNPASEKAIPQPTGLPASSSESPESQAPSSAVPRAASPSEEDRPLQVRGLLAFTECGNVDYSTCLAAIATMIPKPDHLDLTTENDLLRVWRALYGDGCDLAPAVLYNRAEWIANREVELECATFYILLCAPENRKRFRCFDAICSTPDQNAIAATITAVTVSAKEKPLDLTQWQDCQCLIQSLLSGFSVVRDDPAIEVAAKFMAQAVPAFIGAAVAGPSPVGASDSEHKFEKQPGPDESPVPKQKEKMRSQPPAICTLCDELETYFSSFPPATVRLEYAICVKTNDPQRVRSSLLAQDSTQQIVIVQDWGALFILQSKSTDNMSQRMQNLKALVQRPGDQPGMSRGAASAASAGFFGAYFRSEDISLERIIRVTAEESLGTLETVASCLSGCGIIEGEKYLCYRSASGKNELIIFESSVRDIGQKLDTWKEFMGVGSVDGAAASSAGKPA